MKTTHTLKLHQIIILTTALFVVLFYDEYIGLNLGILGVFLAFFTLYRTPDKNRTRIFLTLFVTSVLSGVAFAWFGDFVSFLAVVSSLFLLGLKSRNRNLKSLFVIPVLITNVFTFICRFFDFKKWYPKTKSEGTGQKLVAVILIPAFFVFVFFAIYTYGSDHFANLFTDFELNINFFQLIGLTVLGFFIAFNYWNFAVEKFFYKQNRYLSNTFENPKKEQKPTFDFLNLDFERLSGLISLMALNAMLIIFIITYNYEQFIEIPKTPNQLSAETHERVNAVIMSIVMAILVIMFYFKGSFNFDKKAGLLKISAKIWIFLNAVLVISAMVKNTEYVVSYGLTYKRLGVYAFLILSIIGLITTFIKIQKQKTNAFLFNTMFGYVYGTILVCSYVNWGGIITSNNMKRSDFAVNFHKTSINFSEKQLLEFADKTNDKYLKNEILYKIESEKEKSFLSKILYYETIK
ncbi:MAG: DUF4173 domain-containing protein [Bergeyella sp.]